MHKLNHKKILYIRLYCNVGLGEGQNWISSFPKEKLKIIILFNNRFFYREANENWLKVILMWTSFTTKCINKWEMRCQKFKWKTIIQTVFYYPFRRNKKNYKQTSNDINAEEYNHQQNKHCIYLTNAKLTNYWINYWIN